jgi:hypothetical protein
MKKGIAIDELTESDIGRSVIYRPFGHPEDFETGVITSWNENRVFVRYGNDQHSKATPDYLLEFEHQRAKGTE